MERKYNNGEALPVETRVRMYKKLLSFYESGFKQEGFCFTTQYLLNEELGVMSTVYLDEHPYLLPELYEFRTYRTQKDAIEDERKGYWYRNDQERFVALNKAIEFLTK